MTFDANVGTAPTLASKSVTFGQTYGALATTTRSGFTFLGWFTAASGGTEVTSATTVSITADQTLYAQWATPYEVWAAANGIVGSPSDLTNGVPNLLRYALGGTAGTPASDLRIQAAATSTGMGLSFKRVNDPSLVYEIWATDNLMDWGSSPVFSLDWDDPIPTVDVFGTGRLFLRLGVRMP